MWLHWIVYLVLVYTYTNISHCFPKNYLVFVFIVHLDIVLGLVKWGLSGGGGTDLRTACSNQVEVSAFDCVIKEETKSHISRWFQFCIWASAALDLHPDWFWHSNMLKLCTLALDLQTDQDTLRNTGLKAFKEWSAWHVTNHILKC